MIKAQIALTISIIIGVASIGFAMGSTLNKGTTCTDTIHYQTRTMNI